ncbi:XRE family transcriptional regulator [Marinilabilia rubra]|uniref:DNA-binding protein n=1 Tax=Marinilabilia rubra TaxID=2162893 RepID=A0A2U2B537_9BACT|nr:XRE family transcriptional regulator [Marinilabilia rubra]PWD98172.1 DNA-binding protein [Marinilabilia rubra]
MYFASNLRLLRKRKGLTQGDLAAALNIKRPTLNNYENKVSGPPLDLLTALSDYFGLSMDTLVRVDLGKLTNFQLKDLEGGNDVYVRGSRLRILTSTVGPDNEENIELVPEKAKAGYLTGFSDPEYISSLPVFRLPFLDKEKKYRTFQISGDSMLPVPSGAWITGEFILDWNTIKDGDACVILTRDDGISFKIIQNEIKEKSSLKCISLNPVYDPYDLPVEEIREIWRFVHFISPELPQGKIEVEHLMRSINTIQSDVGELKEHLLKGGAHGA